MAHRAKPSPRKKAHHYLFGGSLIAVVLGAADAAYLLIYKLTNDNAMCLGSGGCHDVNFSPYSEIRGIPISLIGLLAFLAMGIILLLEPRVHFFKNNGPLLTFGISLAGVAYSAFLTYLELYVIRAICPFCVAAAVLMVIICILAVVRLIQQLTS